LDGDGKRKRTTDNGKGTAKRTMAFRSDFDVGRTGRNPTVEKIRPSKKDPGASSRVDLIRGMLPSAPRVRF
jgi:hypothetical protein